MRTKYKEEIIKDIREREEKVEEIIEKLRKKGYWVEDDMRMEYGVDGLRIYQSNRKYIEWTGWEHDVVYERETDFATDINFCIKYEKEYKIIKWNGYLIVFKWFSEFDIGDKISVDWYFDDTGNEVKNKRGFRKVYETEEGWYINQNGERIYFKRKKDE